MPTTVACPTGGEYREALFNTAACFKDPDLVDGKPTLDALGLPKAVSGAFASVFTIESADGNRWAVKCFTRFVDDQSARYQQIGRLLAGLDDAWKVGFEYLPDGVCCRGRWYPALKMEWVDAIGLIQYVEEHLWDSPALAVLAAKFASMVDDLRRHGIAHGDLQHGNILVTSSGDLRLIDYDGMFVPGLDAFGASESGHANYQSPARTLNDWGPDLDHFSAWIIYASIVALTVDPTLWSLLRDPGDEALLFHKEDFTKPASSRAWLALTHSPDPTLQALGQAITPLWTPDVHAVPALDVAAAPAPTTRAFWTPPGAGLDGTGVEGNGVAHGASARGAGARRETGNHEGRQMPEFAPVSFGPSRRPLQVLSVISLAMLAVALLAGGAGALPEGLAGLFAVAVVVVFTAVSVGLFRRTPEHRSLAEMRRILAALTDEASEAERNIGALEQQRGGIEAEEKTVVEALARRSEEARTAEQAELTAVDSKLAARLTELGRQRRVIQSNETAEKGAALRQLQHMHVQGRLNSARLTVEIPGIGPETAAALAARGILTAADFSGISATGGTRPSDRRQSWIILANGSHVQVNDVDRQAADALELWRRGVEGAAQASQPHTLAIAQAEEIRTRYDHQRHALFNQERTVRAQAAHELSRTRQKWAPTHAGISAELLGARQQFSQRCAQADVELADAKKLEGDALARRDVAETALGAYGAVTYPRFLTSVFKR